jgi:excisionase family DNA binding protein
MVHHTERPIIEPNRVYSREEVAEVLNVSLSTVKRLIASGMLRVSSPVGMRRVLIRGQHILDLLEKTEVKPGSHKSHNTHDGADSSE